MLEVIQVQEGDGQRCLVVLCQPNGLLRAFCQQAPVGQTRQRIVVSQPVNALLVGLAVIDFAVQVGHSFAQLARAVLHLSLQLLMGLGQHRLCAFAVGDIMVIQMVPWAGSAGSMHLLRTSQMTGVPSLRHSSTSPSYDCPATSVG